MRWLADNYKWLFDGIGALSSLALWATYCAGSGVPLNPHTIWCNLAKKKQIAGPN